MGQVINAQKLFNRMRMWLAGVQFGGRRDLYEVFGYERDLSNGHFLAAYARQGIAKRVIDAPVLGVWGNPPILVAQNAEFNLAWEELVQTQTLFHKLIRLDKLAGLGRYAVLVVGFDDGKSLETPIKEEDGRKRSVIYLQPYHENACQILEYETDKSDPRFGKPKLYQIDPSRMQHVEGMRVVNAPPNVTPPRQPFKVHWTRLVHVAENLLEDEVFGESRLKVIFNDLQDLLKVSGATAEAFWMLVNRGFQVDVDKDMDLEPEDLSALAAEVEEYQNSLRRFVRTRGVKMNSLGADPVSPKDVFDVVVSMISMGTGIPQIVLIGSGSGTAASRNDRSNWADRCAERIAEYADPIVLKRLLDCMIWAGVLPRPQGLIVNWPEAFKMDPLERAQTSAQMARSAVNLTRAAIHAAPVDPETGQPMAEGPLFSNEEMRQMVSFGKRPPVFDNPIPQGEALVAAADMNTPTNSRGEPSTTHPPEAKVPPKAPVKNPQQKPGPAKTPQRPLGVKG